MSILTTTRFSDAPLTIPCHTKSVNDLAQLVK
jgi:hypothetical protein